MQSVREDLAYLMSKYNASSALLRIAGRPLYYVYDSYLSPAKDWERLLTPGGSLSVRGQPTDGACGGCPCRCPETLQPYIGL